MREQEKKKRRRNRCFRGKRGGYDERDREWNNGKNKDRRRE